MKVTYLERVKNRKAHTAARICKNCGSPHYQIVEQIEPYSFKNWYVRCAECGHEGDYCASRRLALEAWRKNW